MNSPADRVPSHGTHGYGRATTYAVDLRRSSGPTAHRAAPALGWIVRRRESFPSFGQAVVAVADGTVVEASTAARDHRPASRGLAIM